MDNVIRELWEAIAGLRAKRGGANATELQSRHLSATAPTDKDLWIWNADTKKWEPSGSAQVLFCRATANLTLTTSFQSITGDGDSSKVRLLLPTIGDWTVEAVCNFDVGTATSPGNCVGSLFFNDGGSGETGCAVLEMRTTTRATVVQKWKVTVTATNTPVELKSRKDESGGVGTCNATHTTLSAQIGAGGGSVAAASDHGNLDGLGDTADHAWATLVDGSRPFTGDQSMGTHNLTSIARIYLSDGTEALPAFTFTADPNTGLWRPGADCLGLVTAGDERWRIDANGHLVAQGAFSIKSATGNLTLSPSTAPGYVIVDQGLFKVQSDNASVGNVWWQANDGGTGMVIQLVRSRGTVASPTAVLSGDILGQIRFDGWGADWDEQGATILARAMQNFVNTSASGTRLEFYTTPNDTITPILRAYLEHGGGWFLKEQAAAGADFAAFGQIWVKSDVPNTLWFTDDAGTDVQLAVTLAHAASHTDATDDIQDATAGQKGVATAAQITKLDGITALADVTGDNAPQAHAAAEHSAANIIPDANQAYTGDLGVAGAITGTTIGGITEANLVDKSAAETVAGAWTLTGNTIIDDGSGTNTLEIPNAAAPTAPSVDGQVAIDLTVADWSHGLLEYYGGELMGVVAMPIAQFTNPTDNYVVTYNAATDEFELQAGGGGGGAVATDVIWDAIGDLAVGTGADTAAKLASGADGTVLTGTGVGAAPAWETGTGHAHTMQTLTEAPADHAYTGIDCDFTAGETDADAFGTVWYLKLSDGRMWRGDVTAIAEMSTIAMCVDATTTAGSSATFLLYGIVRDDSWNWTVQAPIYVTGTAGHISQTAPSATDNVIQVVGVPTHADRMLFNPQLVQIEHV